MAKLAAPIPNLDTFVSKALTWAQGYADYAESLGLGKVSPNRRNWTLFGLILTSFSVTGRRFF